MCGFCYKIYYLCTLIVVHYIQTMRLCLHLKEKLDKPGHLYSQFDNSTPKCQPLRERLVHYIALLKKILTHRFVMCPLGMEI